MMNQVENLSREINVFLLGPPKVLVGNEEVVFPFKQAEAIFYYLVLERNVSKNKIADLIWGDKCDNEKIKPNIRNAIYVIRKIFGKDFLVETQKNVLKVNNNYQIYLDVETIFNDIRFWETECFSSEFSEGFYLKDNELYNNWIDNLKQYYKNVFIDRVAKMIVICFDNKDYETCGAIQIRQRHKDRISDAS